MERKIGEVFKYKNNLEQMVNKLIKEGYNVETMSLKEAMEVVKKWQN